MRQSPLETFEQPANTAACSHCVGLARAARRDPVVSRMLERSAAAPSAALAAADTRARERALDVTRSFLVQAPAGSGKTELLIQRFLALLARVDMPERIVAMTFTRKAAGEMRERIVAALRDAENATPVDTAHAQRTRELALGALRQDQRQGWRLATHPARLQLRTIDALCASLARQAPLATGLGPRPRLDEHCAPRYEQAAREILLAAAPNDPAWRRLLAHQDNDADRVVALLADMLGKRDQWLGLIIGQNVAGFRERLEGALATEIVGELHALQARFPPALAKALVPMQRYAFQQLALSGENPALARSLAA